MALSIASSFVQETSAGTYIVVPKHSSAASIIYVHSGLSFSAYMKNYTDKNDSMCLRFPKHLVDSIASSCCYARL